MNNLFSSFDIKSAARIKLTPACKSTSDPAEEDLSTMIREVQYYNARNIHKYPSPDDPKIINAGSFRVRDASESMKN